MVGTNTVCHQGEPLAPPPVVPSDGLSITLLAAHEILVGQPIYITPVGTVEHADADTLPCLGVSINYASAGGALSYISDGSVSRQDWTAITGSNDLRPGMTYYLADTGKLTHIVPTTGLSQQIGVAVSRSLLDVEIHPPIRLA